MNFLPITIWTISANYIKQCRAAAREALIFSQQLFLVCGLNEVTRELMTNMCNGQQQPITDIYAKGA